MTIKQLAAQHVTAIEGEVASLQQAMGWHKQEAQRLAAPHLQAAQQAEARIQELQKYLERWQSSLKAPRNRLESNGEPLDIACEID